MVTDTQILNTVACYLLMHVAYRLKTKPVIIVRKAVISRFAVLNLSPFRSPKFLLQLFSFIKLLFSVVLRYEQKNWNTQQFFVFGGTIFFNLLFCFGFQLWNPGKKYQPTWYFVCLFLDDCLNTFRSMRSKYNKKNLVTDNSSFRSPSNASTSIIDTQYAKF